MVQKRRLCLFDIDGTLVTSPIGSIEGVIESLEEGFGRSFNDVIISPKAATAVEVAVEVLAGNGVTSDVDGYYESLVKSKEAYTRIVKERVKDGRFFWKPLPNVVQLLERLSKRDDIKLGLLTANPRCTVEMKLRSANIDVHLFREGQELFGAFGCEDPKRSNLVRIAKDRYCKLLGVDDVEANDIVIIGDTPNDVSCAHSNGVPCVAVATGKYESSKLENADCLLKHGFVDLEASVDALLNTQRIHESKHSYQ